MLWALKCDNTVRELCLVSSLLRWDCRNCHNNPFYLPLTIYRTNGIKKENSWDLVCELSKPRLKDVKSQLYLRAGDSPLVAVAGVAVFIPSASIQSHQPTDHTGPPHHWKTKAKWVCLRCCSRDLCRWCRAEASTFLAVGAAAPWWTNAAVTVDLIHAGVAEAAGGRLALVGVWKRRVLTCCCFQCKWMFRKSENLFLISPK